PLVRMMGECIAPLHRCQERHSPTPFPAPEFFRSAFSWCQQVVCILNPFLSHTYTHTHTPTHTHTLSLSLSLSSDIYSPPLSLSLSPSLSLTHSLSLSHK